MSFDDPNREAVGLPPIWTGAGSDPEADPEREEDEQETPETPEDPQEPEPETEPV